MSRVLFYRNDIPRPSLQYRVHDADGKLLAICDFGWEEFSHVGEFDGRVKYGRYLRPGESAGDAVFREKRREDGVRGQWLGMTRWTWADLPPGGSSAFIRRLRSDLDRSRDLYGRRRTTA